MEISKATFLVMCGALLAYFFFSSFKNEMLQILPQWFIYGTLGLAFFGSFVMLTLDWADSRKKRKV